MAIRPTTSLKEFFRTAKKPTQEQFWDWLDSFWHKSDKVPVSAITNLEQILNGKAPVNHIHPVEDITGLGETLEVFQKLEEKGQAEGYASLDEAGKVPGIIMWSGTIAPQGWAICNGSNGTPDLQGKFIVGYKPSYLDYNAIGKTGGMEEVQLGGNMPPIKLFLRHESHPPYYVLAYIQKI